MMNTFSIDSNLIIDPPAPVFPRTANVNPGPICVGGVGGSGTRVVAEILEGLDVFIGNNLNKSKDNLDIQLNQVLDGINDPIRAIELIWQVLRDFEKKMSTQSHLKSWGWKMPGNFYWLDYLNSYFPKLRYIHVIRHGLDMAYSSNQNQIRNWGSLFGFDVSGASATPAQMLDFWIAVNQFAIDKAHRLFGNRFLMIKFDDLCADPESQIKRMMCFIDNTLETKELGELVALVKPPSSINRYKHRMIENDLSEDSIKQVMQQGFSE